MNFNLTTGYVPSLNAGAGLLGFFFTKTWMKVSAKLGFKQCPFKRQENTVMKTCIVAASGVALSGGLASNMFAMSQMVAFQTGEEHDPADIKNPNMGWMIAFVFAVSFIGVILAEPLRKVVLIGCLKVINFNIFHLLDYDHRPQVNLSNCNCNCPYHQRVPHATKAKLINLRLSCNFPGRKSQLLSNASHLASSGLFSNGSILLRMPADLDHFQLLGFKTMRTSKIQISLITGFHFDFSATYVGVGMICPYIITISSLVGSILSWGIMWPLITRKKGIWYSEELSDNNLSGLQGHEYALIGYIVLIAISAITVPLIIPELKWYHILVSCMIAPVLIFSNVYGCGLIDWSLATTYGRLATFAFSLCVGMGDRRVIAGLASGGIMTSIVYLLTDLMQNFKTAYLTHTSPRFVLISEAIGIGFGCLISPCVFWISYGAIPHERYPSQYINPIMFRSIALIRVKGLSSLPRYCLVLCIPFFFASIFVCGLKEVANHYKLRIYGRMPSMMAMAIPFFIGPYFAIDMCMGERFESPMEEEYGSWEVDYEIEGIENESRKHSIMTVESVFESDEAPSSWRDSLTVRGLFASVTLGTIFTFIVINFNLTTGYVLSLNVGAGLLGFFFIKIWMKVSDKLGFKQRLFTRQENTVIQTCIVVASGVALSGDEVPSPWRDLRIVRGLFANVILGTLFTFIVMNFNLTTRYVPSLNVGAVLLSSSLLKHG
ncbi:putative metal-nicotianamine transporter YSL12 [Cinnamomum micranthum f. kanehirae]|uniref:Putative metal-nicotianamine transporter YSL12 n=1 Tax=Cinnamomum micranthum f. kanehirae TaxID=337451 RepID=A0A3S3NFL7_9MAGN|nr:putative metal-nicotianamine transporter YSL12 [Cinnamomum micranthum f. kanehirae]